MAVLMIAEMHGATPELYEQVNSKMGVDKDHLPDGLIQHLAGKADDGLVAVDVWDSEDSFKRFAEERLGPALRELGVPPDMKPTVHQVHKMIEKGSGDHAGVILIIESDGFGPDLYDDLTARMDAHQGDGSNHLAVSHVAAVKDGGMVFVDVWDSAESFSRFAEEQLGPAAGDRDLPAMETRVLPVQNRFARKG
jgi:hypothetical protein